MKIFGLGGKKFNITEDDRLWVEENFRWLKAVFGYPNKMEEQVVINERFFPATFAAPEVTIDHVVTDLCVLFAIPRESVDVEILTDLRDLNNIPYQIEGVPFECEAELKKGEYKIFIANSLRRNPDRMIYSLIYEFIRIRLTESDLEFEVGGDDTGLFIYLAGIYYGFGVILANNLIHSGRSDDGMWEIKWNYGSAMPEPVMAFSMATYANLTGNSSPAWRSDFRDGFTKLFDDAIAFLKEHPNDLYDEKEVQANDLFNLSNEFFEKNDFESAISTLQKILFITNDDVMKADVYNNMGYYYIRMNDYQQGISNFRKALALGPEYGFANDNLGYALIMTGQLEEGLEYLERALETGSNDLAYTYRNLALYHQRRKEYELAEGYFRRAFDQRTPVDLLEFHYAEFLMETGHTSRAREFFERSADKNEAEGISRLRSLG